MFAFAKPLLDFGYARKVKPPMRKDHIVFFFLACGFYFVAMYPYTMGFRRFYFGDSAWPYTVELLLQEGKIPTVDFAYFYGLPVLIFNKFWFALFGMTPWALLYLYIAGIVVSMIGVVRIVTALQLDRLGSFIVVVAGPVIVNAGHLLLTPVHILEPLLLIHALAAQLYGRYALSLLLVTIAAFVKPSLAYVYGLLLVFQIVTGWLPHGTPPLSERLRWLLPAAGAAAFLSVATIAWFGWQPFLATQIPWNAGKAYADFGHGFFYGVGRNLWWPQPWKPAHYFFTIAGAWLIATVVLLLGMLVSVRHWHTPVGRYVLTCGILHCIFVCFLFGNEWSWIYYPYLLFIPAAAILDRGIKREIRPIYSSTIMLSLIIIGFLLFSVILRGSIDAVDLWANCHRNSQTNNMYACKDEKQAWAEVMELAKSQKVFVLNRTSAVHWFSPPVNGPRVWVLIRSIAAPGEIERIQEQIAAANVIVRPRWHDNHLFDWPEFAPLLQDFRLWREYNLLDIYRRINPDPSNK
ncbi:MAG: hypothetical protein NZU63_01850 [Gemmataceae bacterium]|nr:hypothetical protein [Gemmataceae bacterium]